MTNKDIAKNLIETLNIDLSKLGIRVHFQITNNQFKPLRNINEEYIWCKDAKG